MIRVAVTQRVETFRGGAERRDCVDQRWPAILAGRGICPVLVPNTLPEPAGFLTSLEISGAILTGGNDLSELPHPRSPAPERDATERALVGYCLSRGLPLLGICRGMQMINMSLGGRLIPLERHAGTRHVVFSRGGSDSLWPAQFEVNSFHDFGISREGLAPGLEAAVECADGTVEAFLHPNARCVGVMWHPEREAFVADHDRALLNSLFGLL